MCFGFLRGSSLHSAMKRLCARPARAQRLLVDASNSTHSQSRHMAGTITLPATGIPRSQAAWPLPIHVIEAACERSSQAYFIWKRIFDVLVAVFLLLLLSPLLLLTAIL